MASTVISPNEVILNAVRYRVTEPVRRSLASIYPQKMVLGDYTKDSQTRASVVTWRDWRGGIGADRVEDENDLSRAEDASGPLWFKGYITLPLQVTTLNNDPGGTTGITAIAELASTIYAAWNGGTDVYKYDNTNDDWDTGGVPTKLHDLPAAAVSALNFTHAGTEYIAFACTSGFSYSSNGTAWTDDTTDALYLAYWDDRLWGIDNTGQLWYSVTIGTEVNDAKLPLPAGSFKGLFVGPDASGEPILYCSTTRGLWAHDYDNTRFVKTDLQFPDSYNSGEGCCTWNSLIYVSNGASVYEYNPRGATIRNIGLDIHGIPYGNTIRELVPAHQLLFARTIARGGSTLGGKVFGYEGNGWSRVDEETASTQAIKSIYVSSSNRLYYTVDYTSATNDAIKRIALPQNLGDPENLGLAYTTVSGKSVTLPWYDAFQADVDKDALEIVIDAEDVTTVSVISPAYRVNYTTAAFTTIPDMTSAEVKRFPLPNSTAPAGVAFNSIQTRYTLATSSSGKSPLIRSISLRYRKKLPARWGFQVEVDLSSEYKGNTPKQLANNLITAIESNTLVEFTYRDDTGATRVYYVDVTAVEGLDRTGHKEKGSVLLTLQEI